MIPTCEVCDTIWIAGSRQRSAARYEWTHTNGNRSLLCELCCTYWRAHGTADPGLTPLKVQSIALVPRQPRNGQVT